MPRPPFTRFPKDSPLPMSQRGELTKAFKPVSATTKGQTAQTTVIAEPGGAGITQAQLNQIVNTVMQKVLQSLSGLGMVIDGPFTASVVGLGPYLLSQTPVGAVMVFTDAGFEYPTTLESGDFTFPAPGGASCTVANGLMNFVSGYDLSQINVVYLVYVGVPN